MARNKDRLKVLKMRGMGMSYSQIKEKTGISKSTLSGWLSDLPLSRKRMSELRDNNPIRIERYRETMRKKREGRRTAVYEKISAEIGTLTRREKFLAGLFLYWGEGMKTHSTTTGFTNTDPGMVSFFVEWLLQIEVEKKDIKIVLHLYKDMNVGKEINYWKDTLGLSKSNFSKSYIKDSKLCDLSYKNGFKHGTCNVKVYDRDLAEYVLSGVKYLRAVGMRV